MANKIKFSITPAKTSSGQVKVLNLEPQNYNTYEDFLQQADQFDSTNVSGRLRLTDNNFYKYRLFYDEKKLEENGKTLSSTFAYQHQIQAVETILRIPEGGLLADQVGMGKTIEAGMLIAELAYRDEWRTLMITLSNEELMRNWHDEMYEKFGLTLALLNPADKNDYKSVFEAIKYYQETGIAVDLKGSQYELKNNSKVKYLGIIVPFDFLVKDEFIELVDEYNKKAASKKARPFHIDLIVVDESHRYTSQDSAHSDNKMEALHKLQIKKKVGSKEKKLGRILLLTATPIKNDLQELLQLMKIIDPTYTEEEFREKLQLSPEDPFDLSTVLKPANGAQNWWNWFERFGQRHTRVTTNYDAETRKFGVHWQKKNSHAYYFNDETNYPTRKYFDAYTLAEGENKQVVAEEDLKTVDGRIEKRKTRDYEPLKGKRTSELIEYKSEITGEVMAKFNRLLKVVSYLKNEITEGELENVPFVLNDDGYDFAMLKKEFAKTQYNDWRGVKEKYSQLFNSKEDIAKKKIIEKAVARFFDFILNNASEFIDVIYKYIKKLNPGIQKTNIGVSTVANTDKLALLFCTDNVFLTLQKTLKLGEILTMGSQLSLKLNDRLTAYGTKINPVAIKPIKLKDENGEYERKALVLNSPADVKKSCVEIKASGKSKITIYANATKANEIVVLDDNGDEIYTDRCGMLKAAHSFELALDGSIYVGFREPNGRIFDIDYETRESEFDSIQAFNVSFDNVEYKSHNKEKIIIFCKDDAERRMLVENKHLWDFSDRYRDNQSVAEIAKQGDLALELDNVISIAYTTDAEGLNLQSYHTMINYSIVLSPLHMEQRIGRIDRIGQKYEMDVYFLANAQEAEGYVLRFFEYELELFSNWSGDTTASTYVDLPNKKKAEFDKHIVEMWNLAINNTSLSLIDRVEAFEKRASLIFTDVRERVVKIANYGQIIDETLAKRDSITAEEFEGYYN